MKGTELARRALHRLGMEVARHAAFEDVDALFRLMRPVAMDMDLIRLGAENDGGYLIPDDLAGVEYCFSPGVGDNSSFEEALASRGIHCFLADYSVDAPSANAANLTFEKKYIAASDGNERLSLDTWYAQQLGEDDKEFLLQMDIEGAEYPALLALSATLQRRCRIMAIEFHDLRKVLHPFVLRIVTECMIKLLSTHYVVHAHANNCGDYIQYGGRNAPNLMELTLLRRDRVAKTAPRQVFEHPLDQENDPIKAKVGLPSVWWSSSDPEA